MNQEISSTSLTNPALGLNTDTPRPMGPVGPNRMRLLTISQLDHGYFIEAGCQKFALESPLELVSLVTQYISDPNGTEDKYNNGTLFKM